VVHDVAPGVELQNEQKLNAGQNIYPGILYCKNILHLMQGSQCPDPRRLVLTQQRVWARAVFLRRPAAVTEMDCAGRCCL